MRSRIATLSFLTLVVWGVGRDLPTPPLSDPAGAGRWWHEVGALMAVFGLIRIALLGGAALWAAALAAATVPRLRPALARAADRSWLGRPMLRVTLGLTAAGATAGGCSTGNHAAPAAPVIVGLGPVTTTPARPMTSEPSPPAHPGPTVPPTGAASPPPAAPVRVAAPAGAAGRWVVRPGDDLWSIAAATVAARSGDPAPYERAVAVYWLDVIRANRGWLVNPNLIFPGDVVALPPSG